MHRTYPSTDRAPLAGERVRTDDGIVGVVVLVLPSRHSIIIKDNAGMEHHAPIEGCEVVDGQRPLVYLRYTTE